MSNYYIVEKPFTAFNINQGKYILFDPSKIKTTSIAILQKEEYQTALPEPMPETLPIIRIKVSDSFPPQYEKFAITQIQLDEIVNLFTPKKGDVFKVLQDTCGTDNCYNRPSRINLEKNTLLLATSNEGTRSGDYFMSIIQKEDEEHNQHKKVVNVSQGYSMCPHDVTHLDPRFFKKISSQL